MYPVYVSSTRAVHRRNRHPLSSLESFEPLIPRCFLEHYRVLVVDARAGFSDLTHLVAKRVPHHGFFQLTFPAVLRENLGEVCMVFRADRTNGKEQRMQEGMEWVGGVQGLW